MAAYVPGVEFWFTAARGMDFGTEIEKWDRGRLDAEPSLTTYPEVKGLRERHLGEREGFMAGANCSYREAAFHYSSRDFRQRERLTRQRTRWIRKFSGLEPLQRRAILRELASIDARR